MRKISERFGAVARMTALMGMMLAAAIAAPAQTYSVIYSFLGGKNGAADGVNPDAGLIRDSGGNLYGTTFYGGSAHQCTSGPGCGTVFKVDKTGKETVLHRFLGSPDGADPEARLVQDPSGDLYGTTLFGGTSGNLGTVFKVDPTGRETVMHSFGSGGDGFGPLAGLVIDASGNLYGTTSAGGAFNFGTVFRVGPTGDETVLYSFAGGTDGAIPTAGLVIDSVGNLYGTAFYGGSDAKCSNTGAGCGTVFRVDRNGIETVLYRFTGGDDGGNPSGGLVRDAEGNLYGTTEYANTLCQCGTVFKLDTSGVETVLYSFKGGTDGASPRGTLVMDPAGNLYGTTPSGGDISCAPYGCGTVFMVKPTGSETVLHSFRGGKDGTSSYSGLVRDKTGTLFGTTQGGGAEARGIVFGLKP